MNVESNLNGLTVGKQTGVQIERSGLIAGLIGGVMMAVVGAALAIAIGDDLWKAPKLIATFVVSPDAIAAPGFLAGPVLIGSLIHLTLSALFGVGFGVLATRIWNMPLSYGAPMVLGFVYGLAIWLIAYFIILPLVNPLVLEIYAPAFLIQNLTYGLSTGLAYGLLHSRRHAGSPGSAHTERRGVAKG